jgi:hypothetical protein
MTNDKFLDPLWRLESLYHVIDKRGRKVLFQPNAIQRRINNNPARRKIILKARQLGVSTNELLKMLDFVLFNKNVNAVILAHEQDGIEKLFRIPRKAYNYLDPLIEKVGLDKGGGSKYEMYFPAINSRISADLESRGDTISWLHVSEMAFVKEPDRVRATLESVPINGIITFESTPNGLNHFYDMWMDTDTNYEKLFFPWFLHDEYAIEHTDLTPKDYTEDERRLVALALSKYQVAITPNQIDFRRFKQRELKSMFKQEYPEDDITCFLTSGNTPFDLEKIKRMYDNAPKPIDVVDGIKIYERPKSGEVYVIGADPAEGVNGDASAAHVFKVSNREQVATFRSPHHKPSEFADVLVKMASMYGRGWPPPLLGVERNNHGHAVLLKLDEVLEYGNIFRTRKENKKTELEEVKLGWPTDRVTRPLMLDTLIEGVENETIILNDRETLGECLTLVNNEGKIEAEEGKHDDTIIAAAISTMMCIEESKLGVYSDVGNKIRI